MRLWLGVRLFYGLGVSIGVSVAAVVLAHGSSAFSTVAFDACGGEIDAASTAIVMLVTVEEGPDFKPLMMGGVIPRIIVQEEEEELLPTYDDGVPPSESSSERKKE